MVYKTEVKGRKITSSVKQSSCPTAKGPITGEFCCDKTISVNTLSKTRRPATGHFCGHPGGNIYILIVSYERYHILIKEGGRKGAGVG